MHGKRRRVAGCVSDGIAHHHAELRTAVCGNGSGCGIGGGGSACDRRRTLLPLVTQRSRSRRRYSEGCRLANRDGLARRLSRNRRPGRADSLRAWLRSSATAG